MGAPDRQVTARIGDVRLYLTEPRLTARLRQQWDAAQYLATQRLPERAPQSWLATITDAYPVGIALQLTGRVKLDARWHPTRPATRTPPHLRVQVDRLVWQVCDLEAWRAIGAALFDAERYLTR